MRCDLCSNLRSMESATEAARGSTGGKDVVLVRSEVHVVPHGVALG